ncbi:hypothetical protein [Pontibacter actiniarum]|uniref:Uncharacterized protein n=1 Tax=Pontibacter actiniarum TaxID=323450 RepID=A0A1X9YN28_9BACT|nr:hypothetical protein [Pontibacter actiniarum]ARS34272.1 hypothetical protein CA264_01795 [Pontibacter actiniarum]
MNLLLSLFLFCLSAAWPQPPVACPGNCAATVQPGQRGEAKPAHRQALQNDTALALLQNASSAVPALCVRLSCMAAPFLAATDTGFTQQRYLLRSCTQWCLRAEGP